MADLRTNPFRPGAGRVPPELAGRDDLIADIIRVMEQVVDTSDGDRPFIITGLRGVGKTVLLNEFVRVALESRRWIAVKLEASIDRNLAQVVAQELHRELRALRSPGEHLRDGLARAMRVLRSFQLKIDPTGNYSFGVDISPEPGVADSGLLEHDLRELLEAIALAAREIDLGVLIAIDELQDAPKTDLHALNVALHAIGQAARPVPLLFVGTGLPSLPAVLAEATSYAERLYDFRELDILTDDETALAFTRPAEDRDVTWNTDALSAAITAVAGYPYFVQACGKQVWDARVDETRITLDDAAVGIARARDEVDRGLYRSRWERASPSQRIFMGAMAHDDTESSMQDLMTRLGKKSAGALSVARGELMKNGHIYSPDRGKVAFTVPGMSDFIRRTQTS